MNKSRKNYLSIVEFFLFPFFFSVNLNFSNSFHFIIFPSKYNCIDGEESIFFSLLQHRHIHLYENNGSFHKSQIGDVNYLSDF